MQRIRKVDHKSGAVGQRKLALSAALRMAPEESEHGKGSAEVEQGNAQTQEGEGQDHRRQPVAEGRRRAEQGLSPARGEQRPAPAWRAPLRLLLAVVCLTAGVLHFVFPKAFLAITPSWVVEPGLVISVTGVAEIAGALALLQSWSQPLRRAGGVGLALYALCVFPANINHMLIDMARPQPQLGWAYHAPRMLLQPVLIWLALWVSRTDDGT